MKKLLLIFFIIFTIAVPARAALQGKIDYESGVPIDYRLLDISTVRHDALFYMLQWDSCENANIKKEYLTKAMLNYHILTKMVPDEVHPYVSIGRMYDGINRYSKAKEYFYRATNLEHDNAEANFYFGEFYYKRDNFRRALGYYLTAFNNGWEREYRVNIRLATIYEKLGDIISAKYYYQKCLNLNPQDKTLTEKIRLLDELKYEEREYYLK